MTMTEKFNFDQFLMEKGFSFTNYGTHSLYEIEKNGHKYAINWQGKKMTTTQSRTSESLPDVEVPNDLKSAEKWYNSFLAIETPKPETTAAKKPRKSQ